MTNIDGEISRLSNKDVKIRRKAVRMLFEEDNPRALSGFVKLLDDTDFWFRNKSLDAHRKWANTADDLLPLLENHKRLAAELLQRVDAPDIALTLLEEEDHITRSFAAKNLANSEELHSRFTKDEHHSVRIVAAEFSSDENLISSLIEDKHSAVRRAAISNAAKHKLKIDSDVLDSGLSSSDPSLRSLVATLAVNSGGEILEKACRDINPKVRKAIADTLRSEVTEVDERISLIASISPEIILRWLRSRYDPRSSSLRWSLIENTSLNSRIRSKLIEQMEGRSDVDKQRLAIISEDESVLVKIAAENLSTSLEELGGEK